MLVDIVLAGAALAGGLVLSVMAQWVDSAREALDPLLGRVRVIWLTLTIVASEQFFFCLAAIVWPRGEVHHVLLSGAVVFAVGMWAVYSFGVLVLMLSCRALQIPVSPRSDAKGWNNSWWVRTSVSMFSVPVLFALFASNAPSG